MLEGELVGIWLGGAESDGIALVGNALGAAEMVGFPDGDGEDRGQLSTVPP